LSQVSSPGVPEVKVDNGLTASDCIQQTNAILRGGPSEAP
jgi:hypothetical protein